MKTSQFFLGFLIVPVFILFFYLMARGFSIDAEIEEIWDCLFRDFPFYNNVTSFSPFKFEYHFMFFLGLASVPFAIPYWWIVTPSDFKGKLRRSSWKFVIRLFLSVGFLILIVVGSWFVGVESLSDRRSGWFIYSFKNPVLYYVFFIFPISLISWFVAGAAKFTYLKYKDIP